MPPTWDELRAQFPVLKHWTYFNTATFGPLPRCAVEAVAQHFENRDETAATDFLDWYDRLDGVRAKAAALLGAEPDDIAFAPNAGTALSWVLRGLDWRKGDELLCLEDEFPNNIYAPEMLAELGVKSVRAPGGEEFTPEALLDRISSRTRLILVSAVSYSTGLRPPLARIAEAARAVDALFVVDGTQGVGAIDLDASAVGADVVIVHGYKWMLSPPGAGFVCLRARARERIRPSVLSWRSHKTWRNVDRLHHGAPELPDEAMRYEGGVLNFSGLFAMEAVLDLFASIGKHRLFARTAEIAEATRQTLRDAGGRLAYDDSPWFDSPVVTARFEGVDASALSAELKRRRVLTAARKGALRVSPHFFNNEEDLAVLESALAEMGTSR